MNIIQDKNGNGLAEEKEIMEKWAENCSELYNFQSRVDQDVLNVHESTNEDNYPVVCEKAEATIRSLKSGKTQESTTSLRRCWNMVESLW